MAATTRAWLIVSALLPTEVPNAEATSLAPIDHACAGGRERGSTTRAARHERTKSAPMMAETMRRMVRSSMASQGALNDGRAHTHTQQREATNARATRTKERRKEGVKE